MTPANDPQFRPCPGASGDCISALRAAARYQAFLGDLARQLHADRREQERLLAEQRTVLAGIAVRFEYCVHDDDEGVRAMLELGIAAPGRELQSYAYLLRQQWHALACQALCVGMVGTGGQLGLCMHMPLIPDTGDLHAASLRLHLHTAARLRHRLARL